MCHPIINVSGRFAIKKQREASKTGLGSAEPVSQYRLHDLIPVNYVRYFYIRMTLYSIVIGRVYINVYHPIIDVSGRFAIKKHREASKTGLGSAEPVSQYRLHDLIPVKYVRYFYIRMALYSIVLGRVYINVHHPIINVSGRFARKSSGRRLIPA